MNSVVCIAQVPDTESRIKIGADGRHIDEAGLKFIVSPYDEYALEEAIRLKEKSAGDVTVLSFGPDRVQQALRESLARGATKALHVKGDAGDADSLGIARVLAAAIKSVPHDVVFFGKQGVGTDNSLVGPMVAEILGSAYIDCWRLIYINREAVDQAVEALVAQGELVGDEIRGLLDSVGLRFPNDADPYPDDMPVVPLSASEQLRGQRDDAAAGLERVRSA